MFGGNIVKVLIPALDEAQSIGKVMAAVPRWVDEIVVVDNGSTDATADVAAGAGARVVREPRRGYGRACLAGLAAIGACDVIVFLDADFSDHPEQMDRLVGPIVRDEADLVLGSRILGGCPPDALTWPQRFGTALACRLVDAIWAERFTDLGPFRAVRSSSLRRLNMSDPTYGWTVEMQIKAVRAGLRAREVPVSYRKRIGTSKISGTVRGVIGAGVKILWTVFRHAVAPGPVRRVGRRRLIVFARYPLPGQAKTRLTPALGSMGAAGLQRRMTEHLIERLGPFGQGNAIDVEIRYAGGDRRRMRRWLGSSFDLARQGPGDLGGRMARALQDALDAGAEKAVIVGTDCPAVTSEHVCEAFDALGEHDLVLGPSSDGGYWLIGLRRAADVFDGVRWGTDAVLSRTLTLAKRHGLSTHLLEELSDVDRPDDLQHLPAEMAREEPYISVIIPTLNESANVSAAIASARADGVEIIVVDGGSTDDTVALATRAGAKTLVSARPCRARQMNLGAATAGGEVLLFLHADTILPKGFAGLIFDALSDPNTPGGAFRHATDSASLRMSAISRAINLRCRCMALPYGDQALFVRRSVLLALGGFQDVAIAEDVLLVRRLRRFGRLAILPAAVVTSARRWRRRGPIRTTLRNQLIVAGTLIGMRSSLLKRLY